MDVFSVKGKEMEITMAEIWDVYDENANRTGRVMERGVPTVKSLIESNGKSSGKK